MNMRTPLVTSIVLIAIMAAAGAIAWSMLPADALVAVHWGVNGKANGYAGKTFGFFVIPALATLVALLLAFVPRLEPRRFNLAASAKFYQVVWIGVLLLLTITQGVIVTNALVEPVEGLGAVTAALSLLFIVMGNYFGKTRSNFLAGIRTPWTLSSDLSWEKTHRLAGRLFVAAGAITLVALAVAGSKLAIMVFLPLLFLSIGASIVMSYVYWSHDPDRHGADAQPE